MRILLHWLALSVAIWATTFIVKEGILINPVWMALIVGACLTLINMFLRPIINLLTLPLNVLTLGFFSLFINGAIFWYLGSGVINGFSITTFTAAFVCALVVSVLNWIITKLFRI